MATEIAILPLLKDQSPEDSQSEGSKAWSDTLNTLAQQDGMQRNYWGRVIETPEVLRFFVDWDSVDDHIKFTKKEIYKPFMERVSVLCDMDEARLFHVHFSPHPPQSTLSAPSVGATEIITIYFPEDYSETEKNTFEKGMRTLMGIAKNFDTCNDVTSGWAVEKLPIPDTDGEEGTVYVVLVGWQSVEAHMAFRETKEFGDNKHYLHDAEGLKKIVMIHASCVESSR